MVEPQPSKLMTWVRFPSPAPLKRQVASFKWQVIDELPCGLGLAAWNRVLAHIAQSVEHFLGKEEVTGSSPVMGSIVLNWRADRGALIVEHV